MDSGDIVPGLVIVVSMTLALASHYQTYSTSRLHDLSRRLHRSSKVDRDELLWNALKSASLKLSLENRSGRIRTAYLFGVISIVSGFGMLYYVLLSDDVALERDFAILRNSGFNYASWEAAGYAKRMRVLEASKTLLFSVLFVSLLVNHSYQWQRQVDAFWEHRQQLARVPQQRNLGMALAGLIGFLLHLLFFCLAFTGAEYASCQLAGLGANVNSIEFCSAESPARANLIYLQIGSESGLGFSDWGIFASGPLYYGVVYFGKIFLIAPFIVAGLIIGLAIRPVIVLLLPAFAAVGCWLTVAGLIPLILRIRNNFVAFAIVATAVVGIVALLFD